MVMTVTDIGSAMALVGRWQPDSRARLQEAALELYARDGFAETTVAAVAERAGLTERTFFRYFPDKREVLFSNEDEPCEGLVDAVIAAGAARSVRDAIMAGLEAVANELQPLRVRRVDATAAKLAAGVSMAVFNVAAQRWIAKTEEEALVDLIHATFGNLQTIISGPPPPHRP
jgi:AcrR family transcriptional regulator